MSSINRSFCSDPSLWVHQTPDTLRLCSFVWELFNCRDPIKICRESVWVVQCVHQLAEVSLVPIFCALAHRPSD
jgi:hypothetical protein